MTDHRPEDWEPRDAAILEHQTSAFDAMRQTCPVAHSEFMGWSLFRHQDIVDVLDDPDTFSSQSRHIQIPNGMDPPDHGRYREALKPFFSDAALTRQEDRSRELASSLLDGIEFGDSVEFMEQFAHPYTLQSLCDFVGWPRESWEFLRGWTHGNQEAALSRNRDVAAALAHGYKSYVEQGLDRRRHAETGEDYIEQDVRTRREAGIPNGDDVISRLMRLEVAGERLTDEQIVSITRNWTAGHGTVAAALGIIIHRLATTPELQARLRDDPTLVHAAVDEIPRTNGPLVANRRTATRDVEFGERVIPQGDKLSLMWIAADRDPEVFEHPEDIQLDRDQSRNLLYGHGIHDCIGAGLSRLQLRVAVEEILTRTTTVTLDPSGNISPLVYPSNGFQELPLRFR